MSVDARLEYRSRGLTQERSGLIVLEMEDFDPYAAHDYKARVTDGILYLNPRGIWTMTYRLDHCQWTGMLTMELVLFAHGGHVIPGGSSPFWLVCHNAYRASSGSFDSTHLSRIEAATFTLSGGANKC